MPVILIHGAYLSATFWEAQRSGPLGKRFHLITPDLKGHGHGKAGAGNGLSVQKWSHDVVRLMDQLAIEQAHICGHSLGGMVAQQLAIDVPERVQSLLLVETSYGTQTSWVNRTATRLATTVVNHAPIAGQATAFAWAYAPCNAPLRQAVRAEMAAFAGHQETYRGIWRAVSEFNSLERLDSVAAPTLVLAGARNPQTHAQGRTLARRIPGARFCMVTGAGHLLPMEKPDTFAALAEDFWLRVERRDHR